MFISTKNGTIFEELVVQTVDNLENIGKVISWNGKNKFDYWESENANKFNGKDGTFNQPFMKREKNLEIFNADMCRSYTMTYLRDNFVNGLSVYDYHFKSDIFSCSNMKKEGFINKKCLGNGSAINKNFSILKNIKPVLFPFIWFDESISVKNYVKDELRKLRFANNVVNSLPLKSNKKITDKHASVVLLDRTN
ncbi:lysosome membrane 2 [Brachionus plicatilis]|uniref:Lysosome membrane 2 n=1 Tax=Brachionus plicatilis TaxID=10195 RepID=A0A3M7SFL8_BRAPC|nr:lysosome membrane 2 [Brachionus plicatilis]